MYEASGCDLMKQPGEIANWLVQWQKTLPKDAKVSTALDPWAIPCTPGHPMQPTPTLPPQKDASLGCQGQEPICA